MPQNFGDVFAQSYSNGVKLEQDMQQHAKAVALEEEKLAATQAIETVRSEQLNKQIELQQQKNASDANYQFNSLTREATKDLMDNFIRVDNDPLFTRANKMTADELKQFSPNSNPPEGLYVNKMEYGLAKQKEAYAWQLRLADAREKAKELKDDEFVNNIMSLTKLANENAQGLMKQETIPAQEAGVIPKYFSEQWNQSSMKIILDKIGKLNLFGSGTPAETKFVTDESKLGPAMDKQAQIIQSMEALIMNKKVNPKLASTFLDPQKSALLEMVSSRLVNDDKGLPVLANTQGMNPTTISKVKDILDSYRMQQLIEKTKSLGEQKLGLQVEQLQEKVQ
jgi:hypothetical protein